MLLKSVLLVVTCSLHAFQSVFLLLFIQMYLFYLCFLARETIVMFIICFTFKCYYRVYKFYPGCQS